MADVIEIARKLASLNEVESARKAYTLLLESVSEKAPELEMEAASYIFFSKGNYQVAYTTFISLYNRGYYQAELMDLMLQSFYIPNVSLQRRQYEENCRCLSQYPYFFRDNFLEFDDLPILFFPFNDKGYIPYFKEEKRFGPYVDFNDTVVDRYFFKDLENPILAKDVYSQYQLEYLNDNVRKSEWVARENHIYLHYSDWKIFCAYLQCLKFSKMLREEKMVFLMEDQISQYPIDFKERFGIDYTQCEVKPVGIREVNKLIWHTQLSSHNGGDFFNEICYGHPNLLILDSVMFKSIQESIETIKKNLRLKEAKQNKILRKLLHLRNATEKDYFVAMFLYSDSVSTPDPSARIVPALFFQPHFGNIVYDAKVVNTRKGWTTLHSKEYDEIHASPIFRGFKYIKTFTPMRRITTSYAATTRFMTDRPEFTEEEKEDIEKKAIPDLINIRMLNRSFMIDPWDRLYRDSVLVRFEDGKLNPKATFTALAQFLDIPYTQSMTYCSGLGGIDPGAPESSKVKGFDLSTVYKTYDQYTNDDERAFLEFFFRDAYEFYGYGFNYYTGEPVDEEWIRKKISGFTTTNGIIFKHWENCLRNGMSIKNVQGDPALAEQRLNDDINKNTKKIVEKFDHDRFELAKYLLSGLRFINYRGQPLRFMKKLELDPELLEQPLYR